MTKGFSRIVAVFLLASVFFFGSAFYIFLENTNNTALKPNVLGVIEKPVNLDLYSNLRSGFKNPDQNYSIKSFADLNTLAFSTKNSSSVASKKTTSSSSSSSNVDSASTSAKVTLSGEKCTGSVNIFLDTDYCTIFQDGVESGKLFYDESKTLAQYTVAQSLPGKAVVTNCLCYSVQKGKKIGDTQYFYFNYASSIYSGKVYSYNLKSKKIGYVGNFLYFPLNSSSSQYQIVHNNTENSCKDLMLQTSWDYNCFYVILNSTGEKIDMNPSSKVKIDVSKKGFPIYKKAVMDYGISDITFI